MSEASEAKIDGARLQKNSGRGKIQKGDATLYDMVIDYKEYAKSFAVSPQLWGKVCTDAMRVGFDKNPVLKLIMGVGADKTRLAVIGWDHLMYLYERIESLEQEIAYLRDDIYEREVYE